MVANNTDTPIEATFYSSAEGYHTQTFLISQNKPIQDLIEIPALLTNLGLTFIKFGSDEVDTAKEAGQKQLNLTTNDNLPSAQLKTAINIPMKQGTDKMNVEVDVQTCYRKLATGNKYGKVYMFTIKTVWPTR